MIRAVISITLLIAIFIFFNLISNILLPFVIGTIIAYFLDPAADKLEKKGWPRIYNLFILSLFILFIIIFLYGVIYLKNHCFNHPTLNIYKISSKYLLILIILQ